MRNQRADYPVMRRTPNLIFEPIAEEFVQVLKSAVTTIRSFSTMAVLGFSIMMAVLAFEGIAYLQTTLDSETGAVYDGVGRRLKAFGPNQVWPGWSWFLGDILVFVSGLLFVYGLKVKSIGKLMPRKHAVEFDEQHLQPWWRKACKKTWEIVTGLLVIVWGLCALPGFTFLVIAVLFGSSDERKGMPLISDALDNRIFLGLGLSGAVLVGWVANATVEFRREVKEKERPWAGFRDCPNCQVQLLVAGRDDWLGRLLATGTAECDEAIERLDRQNPRIRG